MSFLKGDSNMAYAHSRNAQGRRQDLEDHIRAVAALAEKFASAFDAGPMGRLLGLCHDIGKYDPAWQAYLLASEAGTIKRGHGPDHKGAGAQLASAQLSLAAFLIQGHHGGLRCREDVKRWLKERSADPATGESIRLAKAALPELSAAAAHALSIPEAIRRDPRSMEMFLRMAFSALVDADYLDTEAHLKGQNARSRSSTATMQDLWDRFESHHASIPRRDDAVSAVRTIVYDACIDAAAQPPGLFRLAVPTGGGKTLSSMAFALRHALQHDMRRVIVAVPFISITDQTAKTYRGVFDDGQEDQRVILEHHSGASVDDAGPMGRWARLASENWDAPIVVTTTVQLFESIFANSTSRCRKNHRLARSVIILDEAQALPSHLLAPILDALKQLCAHYGATVVLSTATQPAFDAIPAFSATPATDIVPDPARLFEALRRVDYEWRVDAPVPWTDIAREMQAAGSALAILNTKRDALAMLDALDDPDALHLSTLLCGAHRGYTIAEVKRRLKEGTPCLLVSTQVVEAGVDVDFPLVMRALGPFDSIIQAAGRCNREGLLPGKGRVVVFASDGDHMPKGYYAIATEETRALLKVGQIDPDDPDDARAYFERLFATVNLDERDIQTLRKGLDYPEVAQRFKMIDDATESVVITTYGIEEEQEGVRDKLERLRRQDPDARRLLRQLQPYMVAIRTREAEAYKRVGIIVSVLPGVGEWTGGYDAVRGLTGEKLDPATLVV